jgi:hypothetical protein
MGQSLDATTLPMSAVLPSPRRSLIETGEDSAHRQVYGYAKEGAAVGRLKGKKTLHPLIATAYTPIARPVLVAIRMRRGKAADVRGAARFLA